MSLSVKFSSRETFSLGLPALRVAMTFRCVCVGVCVEVGVCVCVEVGV